jgi:hypothetical protein
MKINLQALINESLDGLWNQKNFGAKNDPPRKDFGPQSLRQGYNFPYNRNADPTTQLQQPLPELPPNLAWPLQHTSEDLSNVFVKLIEVANKLINCLNYNTSISKIQKQKLHKGLKFITKILQGITSFDSFIHNNLELGSGSGEPKRLELPVNKM